MLGKEESIRIELGQCVCICQDLSHGRRLSVSLSFVPLRFLSSDMGMEEGQALLSFIHASQVSPTDTLPLILSTATHGDFCDRSLACGGRGHRVLKLFGWECHNWTTVSR